MHLLQSLMLGIPMALAGSPIIVQRAPTAPFGLFAYGDGIGGAPVFTDGENAFIGRATRSNDSEAAQIQFISGTDNSLLASPNTTTGNAPTWSNLTFMVPDTTSSSHQVGFTNSTTSTDRSGSGFVFYGDFLLHKNTDGDLKALWYAVPSDEDRIWTLNWNSTDDDTEGKVVVTLKATPPSRPTDKNN
ncbi:putative cytochrome p450 protein [Daldinia childiae]|uniref:putative cytochrome p450 protein n=1 Tax=Daldinia childiae TaxID=326645 RepID=UPI001445DCF1|nr:putative cytochrome p450 protein [Daldinia childiae]KAF3068424.1 putative cytochrome p450 protein [Daldinia childiae]